MKLLVFEQLYPSERDRRGPPDGPLARSGHRIVTDGCDVYCFGGYNPSANADDADFPMLRELWKYNIASRRWTLLLTTGSLPEVSASHTALLLGHRLLIFGGTGFPFAQVKSNRLYQCDLMTNVWTIIECTGNVPGEIYGHAMIAVRNYIFVYGGTTGFLYSNTLHRLDMETKVWEIIKTPGQPGEQIPNPSYRHEIVSDGERLFVFGGGTTTAEESLRKIWTFDLKTLRWELRPTFRDIRDGYPKKRKCHSCVNWKNKVFVCGGLGPHCHFDDIWTIDLSTMRWTKLALRLPKPVYFHSAALSLTGCMYIFGGVLTMNHQTRSDELYRVWLTVPKLSELAWDVVASRQREPVRKDALREEGVPQEFITRFS